MDIKNVIENYCNIEITTLTLLGEGYDSKAYLGPNFGEEILRLYGNIDIEKAKEGIIEKWYLRICFYQV